MLLCPKTKQIQKPSERYGYLEGRESLRGQNITAALMSDDGFKEEVQRAILDFQVSFNMAVTLTQYQNFMLFFAVIRGCACDGTGGHRYSLYHGHSSMWRERYHWPWSKNKKEKVTVERYFLTCVFPYKILQVCSSRIELENKDAHLQSDQIPNKEVISLRGDIHPGSLYERKPSLRLTPQ